MNDSNANNPDGNVIFSGTKEIERILSLMSWACKNGLEIVFPQREKF